MRGHEIRYTDDTKKAVVYFDEHTQKRWFIPRNHRWWLAFSIDVAEQNNRILDAEPLQVRR